MARLLQKLKSVDFYRKIPNDLTEATLAGASISIAAAVFIIFLLTAELSSFLRMETVTEMVVDRSLHGELLRINFNLSFPALPCEFATLDVSDALGLKRLNLTKTVRKVPTSDSLDRLGAVHDDTAFEAPLYDEEDAHTDMADQQDINFSESLTAKNWEAAMRKYDIVVVNFYAPWCPWCQRLAPTWEATSSDVHDRYPEEDGRIRFAKVDCTEEVELCRVHQISAFPSIRVFRHGSDDIQIAGHHDHEAYYGNRTREALNALADELAPTAGMPHIVVQGLSKTNKSPGCNFSGFVLVKKVPGTLHFVARAPGHSVDFMNMNMSHYVHYFYYGIKPSIRRKKMLASMHPMGLTSDWMDKLQSRSFISPAMGATYEHYMQVVLTSIEPKYKTQYSFDAYEYTVQSHAYNTEDHASAKFTYRMSPIQIIVTDKDKPLYHFLISICAVIGGVFTVAGIIDGMVHQVNKIAKKMEIGKLN